MGDLKQFDIDAGLTVSTAFVGQVDSLTQLRSTLTDLINTTLEQWRGKSRAEFETAWQEIDLQLTSIKDELQTINDNLSREIQQIQEVFSN